MSQVSSILEKELEKENEITENEINQSSRQTKKKSSEPKPKNQSKTFKKRKRRKWKTPKFENKVLSSSVSLSNPRVFEKYNMGTKVVNKTRNRSQRKIYGASERLYPT